MIGSPYPSKIGPELELDPFPLKKDRLGRYHTFLGLKARQHTAQAFRPVYDRTLKNCGLKGRSRINAVLP